MNKKKKGGCLKSICYILLLLIVTACAIGAVVFAVSNYGDLEHLNTDESSIIESSSDKENISSEEVSSVGVSSDEVSSAEVSSADTVSSAVESQPAAYINVGIPLKSITPKKAEYAVEAEKTVKIEITYVPGKATNKELTWSVDDESVAKVDADGTVTGLFPGKCNVTAVSKENPEISCTIAIEVVRPGAYPSTTSYLLKVYKGSQSVVAYSKDAYGNYTVEEKVFTCSTGAKGTPTKSGSYKTINKYRWRLMMGPSYGQYATSFSSAYLFHSIPYSAQKLNKMSMGGYMKLGKPASHGCIRLCVADAKWIYDNCELGTPVEVVDDVGPYGPTPVPLNWDYSGWDPTDPDPNNPYNK